jgi:hypothetical protein
LHAHVVINAEVRDQAVMRALGALGDRDWSQSDPIPIATAERAGLARIKKVVTDSRSRSVRMFEIGADVVWASGYGSRRGQQVDQAAPSGLVEAGLRAGLLGMPVPTEINGLHGFALDASDPLADLEDLQLPPGTEEAVGALLVSERLLSQGAATHVERFVLGPEYRGSRRVELVYAEAATLDEAEPVHRIEGHRRGRRR